MSALARSASTGSWLFVDGAESFGGHEVMLLRWLGELRDQGRQPVVLARAGGRLRQETEWCAAPEDLPPASKRLPKSFGRVLNAVRDAAAFMRVVRKLRPGLCIVAEGCLMAQPVYVAMARWAGVKTVVYVPLVDSAYAMGFRTGRFRDALIRYAYAPLPQAWITITEEQARHFAAWAKVRTPVFTLPNTVSHRIEQAADLQRDDVDVSSESALRVLVLGRLDAHQKGLDLLVDFLEHGDCVPAPTDMQITLVGDGPFGDQLRHRLRHSPRLRERLTLQDWSDPLTAFRQHDVLLLPSRFEGVSLVMLEAMALGVAVVASRLPGTSAMLPADCLFPIGDMQQAFAILQRMALPEVRRTVVLRNREKFVACASGAAFADAVGKLSDSLLEFSAGACMQAAHQRSALTAMPIGGKVVSVVIPSRDGRDTLQRALQSLVANAQFIREVIVVFSNSPAEYRSFCAGLIAEYAAHFNIVLCDSGSPSNGSVARNCGIATATAPFIAFLDDDDEWLESKLATYMQVVAERGLTGDFVLFSAVVECNEDHSRAILFPAKPYRRQPIADFVLSISGGAQTSALFLPTRLAQRVGFDPALPRHQDYDFCMRLEEAGAEFHAIDKPLSYWYRRGSSLSKGATFEYCTQWINANRHRMSRAAYIAYLEKEVLAAVRATGRWPDYARFVRSHLTLLERVGLYYRLWWRATRKLWRDVFVMHKPSSAELLQLQ